MEMISLDWAIFSRCPKGAGTLVEGGGTTALGVVVEIGVPSPIMISLEANFPAEGATLVMAATGAPLKGIILFFFFAFPPIGLNATNFHDRKFYQESLMLTGPIVNVTIINQIHCRN